jgi:hypothetical protein
MNYTDSKALVDDLLKNLADRGLERIEQECLLRMALVVLRAKPGQYDTEPIRYRDLMRGVLLNG